MDMPDVGVAVSTGAVGTIVGAVVAWWKAKQPRKIEPDPLHIETQKDFVTVGECKAKMCEMGARIDRVADGQQKIIDKLDVMDTRSEERARETHARIDPLIKELSKNIGQVELMKESFLKAAIGGKK